MINKMLDQAQYELLNYPHRSFGYYLAKPFKLLSGRDNDPNDRLAYSNAVLAKAMMDYYKKHINSEEAREILAIVKRYYSRWSMGGRKVYSLEDAYGGMAMMDMHQITGDDRYKEGADIILKQFIMSAETDDAGALISKKTATGRYVYAEYIGYVCPFLAKYGSLYEDMAATNLAVSQIENFINRAMDEKTVLPYHGYDVDTGMKMGVIGWGQAVGMLLIGMSETLNYMEPDDFGYENIRQTYRRIVDKVESYQAEGGLYHWQLSTKEGPADTAGTAMILYSIAQALESKVLIGIHKSRMLRGVEALKACIQEDGTLPGAGAYSPEFNNYPMQYDAYPWALGPALSLLTMVEEEEPKTII